MRILGIGLGLIGGALLFTSCSKEITANEVPSVVLNSFKAEYPDALNLEWEKENDFYQVEFEVDNVEKDVRLDPQGEMLLSIEEITMEDLPSAVQETVSTTLAGQELDDIEKITMADGQIYYQIEAGGLLKDKAHVFNENGEKVENQSF